MIKFLLNPAVLVALVIPASLTAQTFGPAQNNPFSITATGMQTTPAFGDLDGDGDIDFLAGDLDGNFYGYENIGTPAVPSFNTPFANPFGLTDVGANSTPVFVDLDGDGDLDVMSGELSGDFIFFENTGTTVAPAFGPAQITPFGLSVLAGGSSSPAFADLDNDGDLDMIAGDATGNYEYFENFGSSSTPSFGTSLTNPFGLTVAGVNSMPSFTDLDGDGDVDILSGDGSGDFWYFQNTGTISAPAYAAFVVNPFSLTNIGANSTTTLADLNNDGLLDLLSGEATTGYYYFEQCSAPAAPTNATPAANLLICSGNTTTLSATGTGTLGWYDAPTGGTWLGGGSTFTTPVLTDTVTYYVQDSTCDMSATRTAITVIAYLPTVFITGTSSICTGQNTTLTANGASTYAWAAGPSTASYNVSPTSNTTYYVTGTDANGCMNSDSVMVVVNTPPTISVTSTADTICANESITLTASGASTYDWTGGPSTAAYTDAPTSSTLYTVTGTDTNGCANFATYNVTVNPLPDVSVFTLGSAATATNFTADTYQWVFCNLWITAPGVSNTQFYLSVFSADYAVIITQNGCTDTSDCVTLSAIGINENTPAQNVFSVYPNPASSQISINSNAAFTQVQVLDINGKIVIAQPSNAAIVSVNTTELQNGLYFVRLMNGQKPLAGAQKLVIDK